MDTGVDDVMVAAFVEQALMVVGIRSSSTHASSTTCKFGRLTGCFTDATSLQAYQHA